MAALAAGSAVLAVAVAAAGPADYLEEGRISEIWGFEEFREEHKKIL